MCAYVISVLVQVLSSEARCIADHERFVALNYFLGQVW